MFTQEEIGDLLGVTHQAVSDFLLGKSDFEQLQLASSSINHKYSNGVSNSLPNGSNERDQNEV